MEFPFWGISAREKNKSFFNWDLIVSSGGRCSELLVTCEALVLPRSFSSLRVNSGKQLYSFCSYKQMIWVMIMGNMMTLICYLHCSLFFLFHVSTFLTYKTFSGLKFPDPMLKYILFYFASYMLSYSWWSVMSNEKLLPRKLQHVWIAITVFTHPYKNMFLLGLYWVSIDLPGMFPQSIITATVIFRLNM